MSGVYKAVIPHNTYFYGEIGKVTFRTPLFLVSKDWGKKSTYVSLYNTLMTFIVGKLMHP